MILGFSDKCAAVIGELCSAMDSDGGGVIVVLADKPTKAEFDALVSSAASPLLGKVASVLSGGGQLNQCTRTAPACYFEITWHYEIKGVRRDSVGPRPALELH